MNDSVHTLMGVLLAVGMVHIGVWQVDIPSADGAAAHAKPPVAAPTVAKVREEPRARTGRLGADKESAEQMRRIDFR